MPRIKLPLQLQRMVGDAEFVSFEKQTISTLLQAFVDKYPYLQNLIFKENNIISTSFRCVLNNEILEYDMYDTLILMQDDCINILIAAAGG